MGSKGPRKGNGYEREICRLLSQWWSNGARDDLFYRTGGSGSRAFNRARQGKTTAGQGADVGATDPEGAPLTQLFAIEVKRGYNLHTIQDLMDKPSWGGEQVYEDWFAKAELHRQASGARYWALIVRRDRREPLIFYPEKLCPSVVQGRLLLVRYREMVLACMLLEQFFATLTPDWLRTALSENW